MLHKIEDLKAGNYSKELSLTSRGLNKLEMLVIEELKKDLPPGTWTISVDLDVRIGVQGTREEMSRSYSRPFELKVPMTEELAKDAQQSVLGKVLDAGVQAMSEREQRIVDMVEKGLNKEETK